MSLLDDEEELSYAIINCKALINMSLTHELDLVVIQQVNSKAEKNAGVFHSSRIKFRLTFRIMTLQRCCPSRSEA